MQDSHGKKPLHWYEEPSVQLRSAPGSASNEPSLTVKDSSTAHLLKIVGDPSMPESKWLAACAVAQDVPLVKDKSRLRWAQPFITGISCTCLFWTVFMCYPYSLFVGAELLGLSDRVAPDMYLSQLIGGDHAGLLVCLGSFVGLMASFLLRSKKTKSWATSITLLLVLAISAAFCIPYFGYLGLALVGVCGVSTMALSFVASSIQEALPKSFNARQVLNSTLKLTWLPAMFTVWSIWFVTSGTYHSSGHYSAAAFGDLFFDIAVLTYCAGFSGFAIARASKSKSFKACAAVATILQTPLLLGLLFAATVAFGAACGLHNTLPSELYGSATSSEAWQNFGLWKSFGVFISAPITVILTIIGAYAGVALNRAKKT